MAGAQPAEVLTCGIHTAAVGVNAPTIAVAGHDGQNAVPLGQRIRACGGHATQQCVHFLPDDVFVNAHIGAIGCGNHCLAPEIDFQAFALECVARVGSPEVGELALTEVDHPGALKAHGVRRRLIGVAEPHPVTGYVVTGGNGVFQAAQLGQERVVKPARCNGAGLPLRLQLLQELGVEVLAGLRQPQQHHVLGGAVAGEGIHLARCGGLGGQGERLDQGRTWQHGKAGVFVVRPVAAGALGGFGGKSQCGVFTCRAGVFAGVDVGTQFVEAGQHQFHRGGQQGHRNFQLSCARGIAQPVDQIQRVKFRGQRLPRRRGEVVAPACGKRLHIHPLRLNPMRLQPV